MRGFTKTDLDSVSRRFWTHVEKTVGCWLWTASCQRDGYGQLSYGKTQIHAHRFSWILHNGYIESGRQVNHHCDVRACVRPDHLFIGTQKDNIDDAIRKGRLIAPPIKKGQDHPLARLTALQVREIRFRYSGIRGEQVILAREYGVKRCTIGQIVRGVAWKCELEAE